MKNLNTYLRATKKETIQVQILETVYACPADPPAIIAVNMALIQAHPDLPEHEIVELTKQSVEAVFGDGAFDAWIRWMSIADINRILLWAQYGYHDELLQQLDAQAEQAESEKEGQAAEASPPASPSATSASVSS